MAPHIFHTHLDHVRSEFSRLEDENDFLRKCLAEFCPDNAVFSITTTNRCDVDSQNSRMDEVLLDHETALPAHVFVTNGEHCTIQPCLEVKRVGDDVESETRADEANSTPRSTSKTRLAMFNAASDTPKYLSDASDDRQIGKGLFIDVESMKEKVRSSLFRPKYDVAELYHSSGLAQHIAKHHAFEMITLIVIGLNAIWIAIDTDHNHEELLINAHPVFQVVENLFCTYFFIELVVRFAAFESKRRAFGDVWFAFDAVLVCFMILETWIIPIIIRIASAGGADSGGTGGSVSMGNASILRIARLLRLTRMARMARLLRAMPELMILMKGMVAASRSVFFTLLLLMILLYVFAIAFTQLLDKTNVGNQYFSTVPAAMNTLWIYATLLEGTNDLVDGLLKEGLFCVLLLNLFIVLAPLMVMNMLIGVLVDVVQAVATVEKEGVSMGVVKSKVERVFHDLGLDADGSGTVSKEEFVQLIQNAEACRAICDLGVDVVGLVDMADFFFLSDGFGEDQYTKELTLQEFMDLVVELRGKNIATVKDVIDLRKFINEMFKQVSKPVRSSNSCLSSKSELRAVASAFSIAPE